MNLHNSLIVSLLLASSSAACGGSLTVEIGDGIQPGEQVLVALYDQEAQWLRKSARGVKEAAPADLGADGTHTLLIDALVPGRYAIAVYVDRNGNGKLDRGMFGKPTEPYGFSNGGGMFGPPDFADALIDVADGDSAIRIDLR
jgi:uncharacterized protein (DUF2141 family)